MCSHMCPDMSKKELKLSRQLIELKLSPIYFNDMKQNRLLKARYIGECVVVDEPRYETKKDKSHTFYCNRHFFVCS